MNYKISDLQLLLDCEIKGDTTRTVVSGLTPFFHSQEDSLTFASDEKFLKKINETSAGTVIVPGGIEVPENGKTYLVVNGSPRILMPKILGFFKKTVKPPVKMIEDSCQIGSDCEISPNVYIGHEVKIGNRVKIMPGAVIFQGAEIGDNCIIHSNTVIREFVTMGANCIIQPGAVIGADGFGYIKVNGVNTKIDQIGSVVLEEGVEVGANTTIDRGAIGNTLVKKHTKIDNLVQIAHNDIIGENCIIISQVGIAGSTEVGDNTTLAGQVGVAGHLKIGSNVVIAAKSGVMGDVADNQILSGYPLMPHMDDMKIKSVIRKLPEIYKKLKEIEKKLKNVIE